MNVFKSCLDVMRCVKLMVEEPETTENEAIPPCIIKK